MCFEKELDLQRGDLIESYIEKELDTPKFVYKHGVSKTF